MDLLRRDRPGRHRHVVRPRDAAHAGDRAARAGGDRGRAARPRGAPPRHADARPHARPARACRSRSASRPRCGPRRSAATSSASSEAEPRLAVGQLAGAVGTLSAYGEAGPELQRRLMARLGLGVPDASWLTARDRDRRVRRPAGADHGHARQDRQRGLQPPAPRARRALRGADRGRRRQHHDATEAQPRALRAPLDARPARPRRRRPRARGHDRRARTRRRRLEDRVAGPPPGRRRDRRSRWRSPASSSRACASTPPACARTSTPSAATSSPSRRCSRSRRGSASTAPTSSSTAPRWPARRRA